MNARDRIYTGKVSEWGLPDGTVVVRTCSGAERTINNNGNYLGDGVTDVFCEYKIKSLPKGYGFDSDGNIKRGYCIDVSGFDEEKKKRVQDAFFKLGFCWYSYGETYEYLDAQKYTNVLTDGSVKAMLMYGIGINVLEKHYLITYDELMKEAGKTEQKRYWKEGEELEAGMWFNYRGGEREAVAIHNGSVCLIDFNNNLDVVDFSHIRPIDTYTDKQKAVDYIVSMGANKLIANTVIDNVIAGKIHGLKWVGEDE